MAAGDMCYHSSGSIAYSRGESGAPIYKGTTVDLYNDYHAFRSGNAAGTNTYPDDPTQDKDDIWPLAVTAFDAASPGWADLGSAAPYSAASWWWKTGTGYKATWGSAQASCFRYDTGSYAGRVLSRTSATVTVSQRWSVNFYIGLIASSSGTPGGSSWLSSGYNVAVNSSGTYSIRPGLTLSSYLFLTVFIDGLEPPTSKYAYPDYIENRFSVSSASINPIPLLLS